MLHRPSRWTLRALLIVLALGFIAVVAALAQRFGYLGLAFVFTVTFTLAQLLVRAHGVALATSAVTAILLTFTGSDWLSLAVMPLAIGAVLELAHLGAPERRWDAWRSYVGALAAVLGPMFVIIGILSLLLTGALPWGPDTVIPLLVLLAITAAAVYLLRLAAPAIDRLLSRDRGAGPAGQH